MRVPATLSVACLPAVAAIVVACASSVASPTVAPAFAWSRAAIALPGDVVDQAPGSSGGMICSPCHAEQASLMTGIAATTDGLLAVGIQLPPSTAIAYRSTDGTRWAPDPGLVADAETGGLAVAVGAGGTAIVGRHGTGTGAWWQRAGSRTWQAATDDESLRAPEGGAAEMRAVVAWRDGFVAAGSRDPGASTRVAATWSTTDGLAWTPADDKATFGGAMAFGIAASATRLIAVGASGDAGGGEAVAWASDDGRSWRRVDSPAFGAGSMRAVTWTGTAFVAVGAGIDDDRAVAWTSPDGVAWTQVPDSKAFDNFGKAIRMLAVAATRDGLIAAGWVSDAGNGSGALWTATADGTWSRVEAQVSMSGASLSGVALTDAGAPVVVGTSGYPDNDQASAWYEGPEVDR